MRAVSTGVYKDRGISARNASVQSGITYLLLKIAPLTSILNHSLETCILIDNMQNTSRDRLSEIIDAIANPLALASKDNFSRLSNITGLEGLITGLAEEAIALSPDSSIQAKLRALHERFVGFEEAEDGAKEERIRAGKSCSLRSGHC